MHLVNEAVNNKVDVFVFTSSIAVYGTNQASVSLSRPTAVAAMRTILFVLALQCESQCTAALLFGSLVCLRGCDLWHCRTARRVR